MTPRLATCSSCGASIVWAVTEKGKPIPIDAEPVAEGNVYLRGADDPRNPPVASMAFTKQPASAAGPYVTHFVTCPNADEHRVVKR